MPRPLRLLFRDNRDALEWSEKGWDILRAQAAKTEIDTIIISSEHLIHIPDKAGFLERLEENFDEIHLVGYLRDPVNLFVSQTDQAIRGGTRIENLDSPHTYRMSIRRRYQNFNNHSAVSSFTMRNMAPENLHDADLVHDFYRYVSDIARPVDYTKPASAKSNESIAGAATAILAVLNEMLRIDDLKGNAFRDALSRRRELVKTLREARSLDELPKLHLDEPEMVDTLLSQNKNEIDWINEHLLKEQVKLRSPCDGPPLGRREAFDRMQAWLFSYLQPAAVAKVMQVVARV
jgi:hypothetical protein